MPADGSPSNWDRAEQQRRAQQAPALPACPHCGCSDERREVDHCDCCGRLIKV